MAGLEEKVREAGLLSAEKLAEASARAVTERRPLFDVLLRQGCVDEEALLGVAAAHMRLRAVSFKKVRIEAEAVRSVSARLASHYGVMPIARKGNRITLAVSNPYNNDAVDDIESNLRLRVERVLALRSEIEAALVEHYGIGAATVERILSDTPDRERARPLSDTHDLERAADDVSVVRLVNQILHEAIADRATDIHFEPQRDGVISRRRIDGVLYDTRLPENIVALYPSMVSRIKLMSNLDIVERRLPQDGRARVRIRNQEYDLRISVVPSVHGEDIVIRILPATMLFDLRRLGFDDEQVCALERHIAQPHGILFVTGPTGSGKSTTLYACLSRLNTRERKIITIEDPVEYELRGITQTAIRPEIGLTFARSLRSMLRHDPDVMMVGEVRDRETAEIAIQTAMTGHLVLSTLHTNDAAAGAARLVDMGVDPFLIASSVRLFMAQRLVRLICEECKEEYRFEDNTFYRGKGCEACQRRGYSGRMAICEFLPLTAEIQESVLERRSASEIRRRADKLGFQTLAADGWAKAKAGRTTVEEILRVTAL